MSRPMPILASASGNGPALRLDPRTYECALACVHCGLCLPACPTYVATGLEAQSPRGRIQLIRGLADGKIDLTPTVQRHLDLCLDCRGCETACPSGVVYHELIEETRARLQESGRAPQGRLMRWLCFGVFVNPARLRLALLPVRLMQKTGLWTLLRKAGVFRLLPGQLRKMARMVPPGGSVWPGALPEFTGVRDPVASFGQVHRAAARVGFFAGCVGSVLCDRINRQAIELLAVSGADVVTPPAQTCCGAIHHHGGHWEPARDLARRNIDAFLPEHGPEVDYITTAIAGCGAMLREYDHLLRDDPKYAARARNFSRRVRDISEVLADLCLPAMKHAVNRTATYHEACHLLHAQKVSAAPRKLLARVPGLQLLPLGEADMCCGAAGTYSLAHPGMSRQLAARKLTSIAATRAEICITGNIGCAMQIRSEAQAAGRKLQVFHPVEILHQAVFGAS